MGRSVSDGFMYWYVQDVHVNPQYQGKGIGKEIMRHLEQFVEKSRILDTFVSIGLVAVKDKEVFYKKLGYIARPSETCGPGMSKMLE